MDTLNHKKDDAEEYQRIEERRKIEQVISEYLVLKPFRLDKDIDAPLLSRIAERLGYGDISNAALNQLIGKRSGYETDRHAVENTSRIEGAYEAYFELADPDLSESGTLDQSAFDTIILEQGLHGNEVNIFLRLLSKEA